MPEIDVEKTLVEIEREKLPDKVPIKCHKCEYEWKYSGDNPFYAQCPKCRSQVNISSHRTDITQKENKKSEVEKDLKERLNKMDYGDVIIIEREEGNPIQIEKNWTIAEFFAQDRLVKREPDYWIQERKNKILRGSPIRLSEEDIAELEKKAREEDRELIDEIFNMVDLQKSSLKKLEEYLRSTFSKSKKKIEDYGSV